MMRLVMVALILSARSVISDPEYRVPTEGESLGSWPLLLLKSGRATSRACAISAGAQAETALLAPEWSPEAAPDTEPEVAGTYVIPTITENDGSERIGGRVLVVCGTDATGEA